MPGSTGRLFMYCAESLVGLSNMVELPNDGNQPFFAPKLVSTLVDEFGAVFQSLKSVRL